MGKKIFSDYEFWFVVGSQFLYGTETLDKVAEHAQVIARGLDGSRHVPARVVYKATVKTPDEITTVVKEANHTDSCAGLIVWMHTFSPSKMWINGLSLLQKPYAHLHTQFNRNIPDEDIDMDFMNLNQSAHGDREHGFIAARMHLKRKIIVGYWADDDVMTSLGTWMRSAIGAVESRKLKVVRFGDNMRNVAVTEGDKVGVQIQLGWQVNTWPVAELVHEMGKVTEKEIDALLSEYTELYDMATDDSAAVRYQAREEMAIRRFLDREGALAFSNTFEDLSGMEQLPGLATQHLMAQGYGYGGEGDWKVSAMTALLKLMTRGLKGGTAFMEDYTYDLEPGHEFSLGAHMLEVCPSLAASRPRIEVHPLGIGGKGDPARLVFEGMPGKGIVASLVDMGGRLRLIVQDIEAVKPIYRMPNLPVARIMWKPEPDFKTGAHAWILAGGSHHTVLSLSATPEMLEDWAEIMDMEFVHITKETTIKGLKQQLFLSDLAWKLK
ncbi:L-arabinose isomerase [Parasphaerochaeta coccoides]|uniref:L-arabinose isomerase n=1 Tax=Parasphaerochaeta coccoides (strain ATCC BAA-1237 / DSM 17374 / SPN1) TaxID=760011 RepID=F4GHN4_PARC1|nr:L-arabinose isomerase [Parasphaerochaeta coccoides]AEC01572.1 L-arabinose isomerase [Parasphaerochaeta coccoides DSM 17374]